ncbi:MAG: hypothetical protein HZC43_07035 [Nitrosomonadales bacterium]|nr:hypothetical protein [Nitrosomonadales bacterium]
MSDGFTANGDVIIQNRCGPARAYVLQENTARLPMRKQGSGLPITV